MLKNERIVIKVGTSTLTYATGKANIRRMQSLVRTLADLHNSGCEIVLVTSGAIGVGVGKLGLKSRPETTPERQAAACIGQCELMFMYDKFFGELGCTVGQLLITKSDIENEERRTNLVNAFEHIFKYGAIPIINENDSVAVDEIVYGDNDNLSAQVAKLIKADKLIILTDTDGLFDKNPMEFDDAQLIPVIREINEEIEALAGGSGTNRGTGGMITKIHAAREATLSHIDTYIINGENPDDIYRLIEGHRVGTHFVKAEE